MGIKNFNKILDRLKTSIAEKSPKDYKNKFFAVDISQIIYKTVIAIRNRGADLSNNLQNTSHILGLLNQIMCFLKNGNTPIFIFDNGSNILKSNTIEKGNIIKKMQ